ncbi:hypothetical protein B0H17DRAFT_1087939 [Mycena rosella]|uniref:Uncharacterized protein n=1 Tax=Mycena rosella TaxID=1033263 RepID=A0AAD7D100_MYCRO|nr:hypothetical protein B0H17DRAFT_1087939 [Mycena rosella]
MALVQVLKTIFIQALKPSRPREHLKHRKHICSSCPATTASLPLPSVKSPRWSSPTASLFPQLRPSFTILFLLYL